LNLDAAFSFAVATIDDVLAKHGDDITPARLLESDHPDALDDFVRLGGALGWLVLNDRWRDAGVNPALAAMLLEAHQAEDEAAPAA
jgi:hypothetical protein